MSATADVLHCETRRRRCSPQAEIRRIQARRVKQLLTETDYLLERISELLGFEHPEYMSVPEALEIDPVTIYRWEKGLCLPSFEKLLLFEALLPRNSGFTLR